MSGTTAPFHDVPLPGFTRAAFPTWARSAAIRGAAALGAAMLAGCSAQHARPRQTAMPGGHLTSVSASYAKEDGAAALSWPANHDARASRRWPGPPTHEAKTSRNWPPAHIAAASSTWPVTHDPAVSRAWWPGHSFGDSRTFISPPVHATEASISWSHATADSRRRWPPNHAPAASSGWPREHAVGVSISFPPGHHVAASSTWRGPSPTWPPSHTQDSSIAWVFPATHDGAESAERARQLPAPPWPAFPPDHAWLTSHSALLPGQNARDPWTGPR